MIYSTNTNMLPRLSKHTVSTKHKAVPRCEAESFPRARRVSFSKLVNVKCIPTRSEMSKQEIHDVWFTKCEQFMIKRSNERLVQKMDRGTYTSNCNCIYNEARGLEFKTNKGFYQRERNRMESLFAVLDAQDLHEARHGTRVHPERIAREYSRHTAGCRMKALWIAANDAKLVHGDHEMPFCEAKPQSFDMKTTGCSCDHCRNLQKSSSSSQPKSRNRVAVRLSLTKLGFKF